jgi:general secretion pathway protein H
LIVKRQQGFTLVELLVVFAIAAMVVAVVPSAYQRMRESTEYRHTVRQIVTDLRSLRNNALVQGKEGRFLVDLERRAYGVDPSKLQPVPRELTVRVTVAGTEAAAHQISAIRFLPAGGSTGGTVDILRPSGVGTRVRVDWLTGHVDVEALQ